MPTITPQIPLYTRTQGYVIRRHCRIYPDHITTYHDAACDPDTARDYPLSAFSTLAPPAAADIAARARRLRPGGVGHLTALAAAAGRGREVALFSFRLEEAGHAFHFGFEARADAEAFHAALSKQIAALRAAAGVADNGGGGAGGGEGMAAAQEGGSADAGAGASAAAAAAAVAARRAALTASDSVPMIAAGPPRAPTMVTQRGGGGAGGAGGGVVLEAGGGGGERGAAAPASHFISLATHDSLDDSLSDDGLLGGYGYGSGGNGGATADDVSALGLDDAAAAPPSGPAAAAAAAAASHGGRRWIPYRHTNGVAIYKKPGGGVSGAADEYMVSAVVRGTPCDALRALLDPSSSTTVLGPAREAQLLARGPGGRQVLRIQVQASGAVGARLAPREAVVARALRRESAGIYVLLFMPEDGAAAAAADAFAGQGETERFESEGLYAAA